MSGNIILDVKKLKKYYFTKTGFLRKTLVCIKAVDNISFTIKEGEILGLVGESGCGKSTTGLAILRLEEPTDGTIIFENRDISSFKYKELKEVRKRMQIIFQDPYASLNPRMTVADIIGEPLSFHKIVTNTKERHDKIVYLLNSVGLTRKDMFRYPHEFSGGQRQRIGIARALTVNPKLIIADEPVSALDVSIQAQILNMLKDLQKQYNLTYLFISHDLSVIRHMSDRIAVMYLGKIVEMAKEIQLYNKPLHPYTEALLSSIPIPSTKIKKKRIILNDDVPNPVDLPSGCRFHPRCHRKIDICSQIEPKLQDCGNGHHVACHIFNPINDS